jgi:tripartite-type tricarboxylate transporter receptor subunit TctC
VPVVAGGPADATARLLAERMRAPLGQAVIIENVSGADGTIGTGRNARARPDGYTVDLGSLTMHVLNGAYYALQYDVLNDFAPILPVARFPSLLFARKTIPAANLSELIDWLRANPDRASAGVAVLGYRLLTLFFQQEIGTRFTLVPYRGSAPAAQDLAAGQIDLSFITPTQLPLARAGSIKAYAVTSETRLALAPDIPTFGEMGLPNISYSEWFGLFAPKGTPKEIINRLNAAAAVALADPAVRAGFAELGEEIFPREQQTPEALGALVKADAEKWWPIMKAAGIKAE